MCLFSFFLVAARPPGQSVLVVHWAVIVLCLVTEDMNLTIRVIVVGAWYTNGLSKLRDGLYRQAVDAHQ